MWQLSQPSRLINADEVLTFTRARRDELATVIYKDGKPVERQDLVFRVRGTVQPVSGKDLALLPEGERVEQSLWVWSSPSEEGLTVNTGDRLTYDGDTWQVQAAEGWGSYVRSRVERVDVGPQTAAAFELNPYPG